MRAILLNGGNTGATEGAYLDNHDDDDHNDHNDDGDRRRRRSGNGWRSVWDIPPSWGRAWLTIFTVLSALGLVVAVLHEIFGWTVTGAIISVIIVMAVVFSVAAVSAFLILRGANGLMVLTHWLQQQTRKQRAQQRAEGVAEGISIGVVQGQAQGQARTDSDWRQWYQRQLDKGAVLDEPPPPPPENPDDGA